MSGREELDKRVAEMSIACQPHNHSSLDVLPLHLLSRILIECGYWKRFRGAWWHSGSDASAKNEIISCALVSKHWRDALRSEPLSTAGLLSATFGLQEAMWRSVLKGQGFLVKDLLIVCKRQKHQSINELLASKDKNQRSMLSRASELGHLAVVEEITLHIHPCDVLELDQLARHSAHWSAARGRHEVLKSLISYVASSAQHYENKGKDVTAGLFRHPLWNLLFLPDSNGQTPIMLAAYNGHLEAVKVVLAAMHSFAFHGTIISLSADAASGSNRPPVINNQPSFVTGRGGGQGLSTAGSIVAESSRNSHFLPLGTKGKADCIGEAFEWLTVSTQQSSQEEHDCLINEIKEAQRLYKDSLNSSLQLCRMRKYVSVYRAIHAAQNAIGMQDLS